MGDFNVDFLQNSTSKLRLQSWCADNYFTQLINEPTREYTGINGKSSSTCIDLCISRSHKKLNTNVISTPLSDHHLIILNLGRHKVKSRRKLVKTFTLDEAVWDFASRTIPNLDYDEPLETLASKFTSWLQNVNSQATSFKYITINNSFTHKPWYTPELKALKICVTNETDPIRKKKLRNRYVNDTRKAKKKFVRQAVLKNKKRGGVWSLINRKASPTSLELEIDGQTTSDKSKIAAEFKDTFSKKMTSLKKDPQIEPILAKLRSRFHDIPPWDISPCCAEQVEHAIDGLKSSFSSGPDDLSGRLLKFLKPLILPHLCTIINKSITLGIFPSIWKSGKITPVPKKGCKKDSSNYRPICVASNLGKVLEGVVRSQIMPFIDNILPSNMHGFRPGKSTESALCSLLDKIHSHRASGKKVALLALDASSAFDTISHQLILTLIVLGWGRLCPQRL